ncbi:hypothetical protein GCM10009092_00230 [Bowmanella denitrificans]|uniref:Solute-binding protein family 3/N-terminal domain-containing protein n=1 Tax=Bowmanella denitrificans TaxID=366582 RepID=A0ABP3GCH8_9ALTE
MRTVLIVLTSLLFCLSSVCQETPAPHRFTWAINDAPPFHIHSGKYQGQGFCDVLVNQMQKYIPGQHELLNLPPARIAKLREQGAPLCFPCMIKRQDTSSTRYSDATLYYQPHKIITNPSIAASMQTEFGLPVPLTQLLQDQRFSFGRPLGRQYGAQLQPVIDQYADQSKVHTQLSGPQPTMTALRLVANGKLDYSLDYRVIGRHFELTEHGELTYLDIQENQNNPIIGAVGCSNSEWGKESIARINQALPLVLRSEAYLRNLDFWFAADNQDFWHRYRHQVLGESDDKALVSGISPAHRHNARQ